MKTFFLSMHWSAGLRPGTKRTLLPDAPGPEAGAPARYGSRCQIFILSFAAFVTCTTALRAGSITGLVHAEGKREAEQQAGGGKYDSHKYKFAERIQYSE